MSEVARSAKLTKKDFTSDQDVRWCPGCGDYAILAQMQRVLPELGIPREQIVFISGIGCSSRFPYYMNTYGIHSIHGRAPTLATGLKATNPDLSVWVVTGDGDGLSIGGNHLIHAMRRNQDIKVLLFNNRIYGLTKGQYSPTSLPGHRTGSTPLGSVDYPFNPLALAMGAGASFIARTQDNHTKHLSEIIRRAAAHKGTAFIEIYQNCVVYNPTAWDETTDQDVREDNILFLEEGQPLVFGKDRQRGLRLNGLEPEVVSLGDQYTEADLLVHEEGRNGLYANMLAQLVQPDFPLAFGVLRTEKKPTYSEMLVGQVNEAIEKTPHDLNALFRGKDTWTVN